MITGDEGSACESRMHLSTGSFLKPCKTGAQGAKIVSQLLNIYLGCRRSLSNRRRGFTDKGEPMKRFGDVSSSGSRQLFHDSEIPNIAKADLPWAIVLALKRHVDVKIKSKRYNGNK